MTNQSGVMGIAESRLVNTIFTLKGGLCLDERSWLTGNKSNCTALDVGRGERG